MKYLIWILVAIALIVLLSTPLWSLWLLYPYLPMGGILVWLAVNGAILYSIKNMVQWRFRDWPAPDTLPEEELIN